MENPDSSRFARGGDENPDDLENFVGLLDELRSTGCNVLICGDVPRPLFTRASSDMFGSDEEVRYRALAVTDASARSVAKRLPDPADSPLPVSETTHVLNHAGAIRSLTDATSVRTPTKLAGVTETKIADPQLDGLQSELLDAIDEFAFTATSIHPADIRVGIDSLEPLLDFYGEELVRDCLQTVGRHVYEHDAMAHYVLPKPYESDSVQALADEVDAIMELRVPKTPDYVGDGKQRWHVPDRELSMDWIPL